MERWIRNVLITLVVVVIVGVGQSQTGFERYPFFEYPDTLLSAHGVEMMSSRLVAIGALVSSDANALDDDDLRDVIDPLDVDFRRFAATLAASDAGLAEELEHAIEALEDANAAGHHRAVAESASVAFGLAEQARTASIGNTYREHPDFTAVVMATMLTSQNFGLGRVFEEAVEDDAGLYATAWATLQRAQALWAQLEPLATETQSLEVEDKLAELGALFPGPRPTPEVARGDPEEARRATQSLGVVLEEIVNADLYPPRDVGRTFASTRELSVRGCEAHAAGDGARGLELISNAAFLYAEYLDNTLATLSPQAAEEVGELYGVLAPGAMGEDEGEDEAQDGEHGEQAEPLAGDEASGACRALLELI
jgi:hypothetical protein